MRKFSKKGFTLIELLVVLVIMSLVTIVFLVQQNKFDSSTLMRALAYNIALSIRQAQVYGVSVIQTSIGSGQYAQAYGIAFDTSPTSPLPSGVGGYYIFADTDGNNFYSSGEPLIKTWTLNGQYSIYEVCAQNSDAAPKWRCSLAGTAAAHGDDTNNSANVDLINILFKRPNPDAVIKAYKGNPHSAISTDTYQAAYIMLQSANSKDVRVIKVTPPGTITVCGAGNLGTNYPSTATGVTISRIKTGTKCI